MKQVQTAILEKLGSDYSTKLAQGLNADNLQAIVDIFQVAEEQGCTGDKLLFWVSEKLQAKSVKAVELRISAAFIARNAAVQQQRGLDTLYFFIQDACTLSTPLLMGCKHKTGSFAFIIQDLLSAIPERLGAAKLKVALRNLFSEIIRRLRMVRDVTIRHPLEKYALEQCIVHLRLKTLSISGQALEEFEDKLVSARKCKKLVAPNKPALREICSHSDGRGEGGGAGRGSGGAGGAETGEGGGRFLMQGDSGESPISASHDVSWSSMHDKCIHTHNINSNIHIT